MKQESGTVFNWQEKSESPGRRCLLGLRWPVLLAAAAAVAMAAGFGGEWAGYTLLIAVTGALCLIWRYMTLRRRQSSWRGEPQVIGTLLARPPYRMSVQREWHWISHPVLCVPLALALTAMLYWAAVLNYLQLPFYWLVALALMLILNISCWKHPLWLALFVSTGVGLLSLLGWLSERLSLLGAMALLVGLLGVGAVAIAGIGKRFAGESIPTE